MDANYIVVISAQLYKNGTATVSIPSFEIVLDQVLICLDNLAPFLFTTLWIIHGDHSLDMDRVSGAVVFGDFEISLSFDSLLEDKYGVVVKSWFEILF